MFLQLIYSTISGKFMKSKKKTECFAELLNVLSIKNNNFGKLGVQKIIQRKIIYNFFFFFFFFLQKFFFNTLEVVFYS